ncbi:MAG TPA: MFS transporter [Legionella sp.]|nr:MFS transporter [Legionella sp.]
MQNRNIQLFIVIATSILTSIATDIILPSLPQIAHDFNVSSNNAKLLISVYMAGQFVTVLIWGIIADQLGRRATLLLGMLFFLLGSVLSLWATSINLLLFCRFSQGIGAVVVPVAGWALIQDLFPKDEGARIMSWIGTIIAILPLFAPAIGGAIDVRYGWQTNLYCIAAYAFVLCTLMILLPGQMPNLPKKTVTPLLKSRLITYRHIIRNRTFVSYITLFGLLNAGEWCFLTVAPFYFDHKHLAADQMGILLMLSSTGFVFGSLLASRLFKLFGVEKTILIGIQLAIASSVMLLTGEYYQWTENQMFNALVIGIFVLSSALLWGGTTSRALQCFDDCRGSASAVRSLILLCFTFLGTYSGRIIDHSNLYYVGVFLFMMGFFALIVFHNKTFKMERRALNAT